MLSARVVLANGSVVVANKCSHPDLFWSLRGGGGGVAGVVTEFTVRTHPAPRWMTGATFVGNVTARSQYPDLLRAGLKALSVVARDADQAPNGGLGFGTGVELGPDGTNRTVYKLELGIQGYESNFSLQKAMLEPLLGSVPKGRGTLLESRWDASEWDPKHPAAPWWSDSGGDKAATTVSMMSRFIPLSYISTENGRRNLADAWAQITDELPLTAGIGVMIPKAQGGISPELRARFDETALNPVILDTAGTLLQMTQLPWFDQLPPSSAVLKAIWPRLGSMTRVFTNQNGSAITTVCEAGLQGDEAAAKRCLHAWEHELVPEFQRRTDKVRDTLGKALPNVQAMTGKPFSGAYWSETDYFERDFQLSYWGAQKYAKLLDIKARYDPRGLFVCRHCVGSEFWTEASHLNCRNTSAPSAP